MQGALHTSSACSWLGWAPRSDGHGPRQAGGEAQGAIDDLRIRHFKAASAAMTTGDLITCSIWAPLPCAGQSAKHKLSLFQGTGSLASFAAHGDANKTRKPSVPCGPWLWISSSSKAHLELQQDVSLPETSNQKAQQSRQLQHTQDSELSAVVLLFSLNAYFKQDA